VPQILKIVENRKIWTISEGSDWKEEVDKSDHFGASGARDRAWVGTISDNPLTIFSGSESMEVEEFVYAVGPLFV
jgi:hypothetical protein